jgi:hypothetical protein
MFESFTSNPTPAESILAQVAGSTPAAAIMGDLDELGSNRGHLWYWTAYARTLISLGWRTLLAFVAGFAGFWLMMSRISVWLRRPVGIDVVHGPHGAILATLAVPSTAFLMLFSMGLWFVLPYAIVRFGHRDRTTQLCFAYVLLTTPFFFLSGSASMSGSISPVFALLTIALILAALFSSLWRKPMIVLAATSVVALAALEVSTDLVTFVYRPYFQYPHEFNLTSWTVVRLTAAVALANAAILCTWLHDRLLRPRSTGAAHA